ncbi:hypothetical protein PICST_52656 [Scheffersomyces stipitis CBS 6054]|uniref:Pre-mRNA-splicing factor 38 n=1 Tax=Scheffersomyces stipitis (strain ATCC 58785 / CBS 6054 / NBRC 10063 / NRRL Y-11545) TaxID=322104 RepID=A3GFM9_PICST|nr:conserved hypothetical protein [Scheffersomyces stipitis CBS 6054]EAZ63783.2 hypothetical protein PICST_52656 [Scheffersomyces stipitis CBS 6054]KAG2731504.1 hypothetical protein G9P44_005091 [Scheffersomyces stipitis]
MTDNRTYSKQASYQDKRNVLNRAHLIEPIVRHRIQDSLFYKQHLHLTNEASILPVIIDQVHYLAGMDSSGRPSPFICCLLRLLELEPSMEIVQTCLDQLGYNEFKYLTALMLIYIRLVGSSDLVYTTFDKYLSDFRKLRTKLKSPIFNEKGLPINYRLTYFDEWIDNMLLQERVMDIILPRLTPRRNLVEKGLLEPRTYAVRDEIEEEEVDQSKNSDDEYESDSD